MPEKTLTFLYDLKSTNDHSDSLAINYDIDEEEIAAILAYIIQVIESQT